MPDLLDDLERRPTRAPQSRSGPIRSALAAILLLFGALFGRLSHVCNATGRLWLGDQALFAWRSALSSVRSAAPHDAQAPMWERRLLRAGPAVLAGIGGALLTLWTLLILGGLLAWLVMNGYGLLLLVGAVALGAILGARQARLSRQLPPQDGWN